MVLIILPALRSGGTEWQLLDLLENSTSADSIILWIYDRDYEDKIFFRYSKIKNLNIIFGKSFSNFIFIIKSRPRVIISYAINYYIPEIIVKIISKAALITERRNSYHWFKVEKRKSIQEYLRNWMTDVIICNSSEVQRLVIQVERNVSSKTTVIYNSVFITNQISDTIIPVFNYVVTATNIKKGKGVERVFRAFISSSIRNKEHVFNVFGRLDDPSVFGDFDKDHVGLFYKGLQGKDKIYRYGSILVHLSESEGFPNAVLEALAAGMLVIISDIPVHREIFSGHAEFVSSNECASLYIDKLIDMASSSKENYINLCQANIKFAENFSQAGRADKYWKLINELA